MMVSYYWVISCDGCYGYNVPYALTNEMWDLVKEPNIPGGGFLCLECVEKRLGRTLQKNDFILDAPINNGFFGFHWEKWVNERILYVRNEEPS